MKKSKLTNLIITLLITVAIILPPFTAYSVTQLSTREQERIELEQALKDLEAQITKYEQDINLTQKEKNTLLNQISLLKKKVEKLNLQIGQANVMIKDLGLQIIDTGESIVKTTTKINEVRVKLSSLLQSMYEEGQKSTVEIIFSETDFSNYFDNVMALEAVSGKSHRLLDDIKNLKTDLESQKIELGSEKQDLEKVKQVQTLQKTESEAIKREQENLLAVTKGKESEYQKMLAESKKKATEIRSRIFALAGIPQAPTFGEALDIARYVEGATGVRAEFLLAILTQESNLGKNVGQCYLSNTTTGDGTSVKTGKVINKVMKPGTNIVAFLSITKELGRDPFKTVVSCPMSYGWGGAMGPAQFIPATWDYYRSKVKATTGSSDPWNIRDAFVGAAYYLKDKHADTQLYNDEWKAAISYFAGSPNLTYRFYGDSVMAIAKKYEADIKTLESGQITPPLVVRAP
ncbi:MAG: lytic murein transglycosylase [bacterium]